LAELTYRLAAKDIVVSTLRADWSAFGSWELQAQRGKDAAQYAKALLGPDPTQTDGPEVVRVLWDGRDRFVTVEASPTRFCCAPNEWKQECANAFDNADEALLPFVENYLTKRLGS